MKPQNTTISALVVLDRFPMGQRRLRIQVERKEKELGRKLNWEEFMRFAEALRAKGLDAAETILRAMVYENPYARFPLAREIFNGPFDERFGPDGEGMKRVFAGNEIHRLEVEEADLK